MYLKHQEQIAKHNSTTKDIQPNTCENQTLTLWFWLNRIQCLSPLVLEKCTAGCQLIQREPRYPHKSPCAGFLGWEQPQLTYLLCFQDHLYWRSNSSLCMFCHNVAEITNNCAQALATSSCHPLAPFTFHPPLSWRLVLWFQPLIFFATNSRLHLWFLFSTAREFWHDVALNLGEVI